jgi:DNA-binding NarL/FixJ family response regulator
MTSNPGAFTRILIVEDDPAFRMMCQAAIGHDASLELVASCSCARQAMVAVCRTSIDVALVDLGLPDGSGIDVIRAIRYQQPRCDIMVISVFQDEEVVLRAIEAGAAGYLLKDSPPSDIVAAIRAMRAGGAPINPMIARLLLDRIRPPDATPQFEPGRNRRTAWNFRQHGENTRKANLPQAGGQLPYGGGL